MWRPLVGAKRFGGLDRAPHVRRSRTAQREPSLGEVGAETGEPAGRWVDNDGSRSVTLGDQLTGK
jgi:hypothetical protein